MRIAQISDCHLFADLSKCGYANIKPYKTLASVLQIVSDKEPDLVLFTGDISGDDSKESYQHFRDLPSRFLTDIPFRIIAGNHDVPEIIAQMFPHQYRRNQLETIESTDFMFLDTFYRGTTGLVDLPLFDAHINQINQSARLAVIVMHHHPIDTGSWMDKHELINRTEFCELLKRIERKVLLLHGHIHHASEKTLNNVTLLSCPSSCWQWQMTQGFGVTKETPGFRLIELDGAKGWNSQIIRI